MRTHGGGATCENFPARGANVHAPRRALWGCGGGRNKKQGGGMCKKVVKKYGILARAVIWLAWHFLKPKCEECDENKDCAYYKIMTKKES
jgi:hypothetical protein